MPNKLRDPLFDLVKSVAMFMVGLSHTISYRIGFDFSSMPSRIVDFIMVVNMPFYWFGLTALQKVVSSNRLLASTAIVGGVAMFFATCCTSGIFTNGLSFYWDRFDVWNPDLIKAANMCSRYIIGILGSLFVFGILKMITQVFLGILSIAFIGKETLGDYFLHGNLIHFVGYRFVDLESNACMLFIAAACIFVAAFGIVVLTKRINFVDKVVWGVRPHWQF